MIKIYNKDGVILNTKDKICTENLEITVDTADLTPENILKGKRILGVSGTAETTVVEGGIIPEGEITLTKEGTFDVTEYASAKVEVEKEEKTITPTKDTINVYPSGSKFLKKVVVNPIPSQYIWPSGITGATVNGRYDCKKYEWFDVNVPETIPEGYIKPEGTILIEENSAGGVDVSQYKYASVMVVPKYQIKEVTPTKDYINVGIDFDAGYNALSQVTVNPIPDEYIIPTGNFEITQNGNYNISDKETVSVNVATGGGGEVDALWDDLMKSCLKDCNTSYLFRGRQLTSFDKFLAGYDTHQVTSTEYMFAYCSNATSVPLFNTMSSANMGYMFTCCYSVKNIPEYDTSNATNMQHMFNSCSSLTTIPQLNTSNVTNMTYMFANCSALTNIPQLNTGNVTDMSYMFANCHKLASIPQLDTSNVVKMNYMFQSCTSLTSLQLNTIKATNLTSAFRDCSHLDTVDLTHMNTSSSTYGNYMFNNCYSLKKVIIRNMTKAPTIGTGTFQNCYHIRGTVNATYNPDGAADGYVYVPDDMVATLKATTNWSAIATQIKPLSELEE